MYAHSIALCASIKRKYCGNNTFSGILESFCNLQTISSVLIHKLRLNLRFSGVVCPGSPHCLRCGWTGVSLSLLWIIALPEAIWHLCSVVYRIMRDCTVAYRHMVGHSCGSSRKVFGDCLDCQGSLSQCARKQYTKVQKKPFSDKMREKALENRFLLCYNSTRNTSLTSSFADTLHLSGDCFFQRTAIQRKKPWGLFFCTELLYHFFGNTARSFRKEIK